MITETTTNTFQMQPTPHQNVCPACGYCPHCHRGGYQPVPHYYGPTWIAPYVYPWPQSTGGFVPPITTTVTF